MSTARNGGVEIYYEEFGDPEAPTLLLINGLGSQCLNYDVSWCQLFCDEGFHVVRFDNRDVGLSTKCDGSANGAYALVDMANDAVAVLDAMGVEKAHVMGCSMGGMIAQRLALDHTDRVLSLTSVMSRTGEPATGTARRRRWPFCWHLRRPRGRPTSTARWRPSMSTGQSPSGWTTTPSGPGRPPPTTAASVPRGSGARCRRSDGTARGPPSSAELHLPALVIHGSRDTLIDPSGGRQTASVIPGARYVEIEGMGHDYPPPVWREWVTAWSDFARSVVRA